MTLLPSRSMPVVSIWDFLSFDSFAHATVFAIQVLLLIVGLIKQHTYRILRFYAIRISLAACTLFGILIELIQHFLIPGRSGNIADIISDTAGVLIGVGAFYLIYQPKN